MDRPDAHPPAAAAAASGQPSSRFGARPATKATGAIAALGLGGRTASNETDADAQVAANQDADAHEPAVAQVAGVPDAQEPDAHEPDETDAHVAGVPDAQEPDAHEPDVTDAQEPADQGADADADQDDADEPAAAPPHMERRDSVKRSGSTLSVGEGAPVTKARRVGDHAAE